MNLWEKIKKELKIKYLLQLCMLVLMKKNQQKTEKNEKEKRCFSNDE
ncbi:hypothetical protein ACMBCM_03430 [Spiroplasma sp. K1]